MQTPSSKKVLGRTDDTMNGRGMDSDIQYAYLFSLDPLQPLRAAVHPRVQLIGLL